MECHRFLTRRYRVSRELGEPGDGLRVLVEASRVTVARILGVLQTRNWIEHSGETYVVTPLAVWIYNEFTRLVDEVEAEQRLRKAVQWIPTDVMTFEVRCLRDAEMILLDGSDAIALVRRIIKFHRSGERVRGVARAAAPKFIENQWELTVHGDTQVDLVLTPETLDVIWNHPPSAQQFREMLDEENSHYSFTRISRFQHEIARSHLPQRAARRDASLSSSAVEREGARHIPQQSLVSALGGSFYHLSTPNRKPRVRLDIGVPCVEENFFECRNELISGELEMFDGVNVNRVGSGMATELRVKVGLINEVCEKGVDSARIAVKGGVTGLVSSDRISEREVVQIATVTMIVEVGVVTPYGLIVEVTVLLGLLKA